MVGYHLKPLPSRSPSIAQAEPIVEKSDDELDPLVLVLLPITILVGILALISVISKFVGRPSTMLLTNCIFPFLYLYYQLPSMCPPLQMCRSPGEHYMDPLTSRVAPSRQLVREVQLNICFKIKCEHIQIALATFVTTKSLIFYINRSSEQPQRSFWFF